MANETKFVSKAVFTQETTFNPWFTFQGKQRNFFNTNPSGQITVINSCMTADLSRVLLETGYTITDVTLTPRTPINGIFTVQFEANDRKGDTRELSTIVPGKEPAVFSLFTFGKDLEPDETVKFKMTVVQHELTCTTIEQKDTAMVDNVDDQGAFHARLHKVHAVTADLLGPPTKEYELPKKLIEEKDK